MCHPLYDRLDVSDEPIHEVIVVRARNKTRLYCNSLRCKYDEVVTTIDTEEIEEVIREHESMNNE